MEETIWIWKDVLEAPFALKFAHYFECRYWNESFNDNDFNDSDTTEICTLTDVNLDGGLQFWLGGIGCGLREK